MLVTVEESKSMWCPKARVVGTVEGQRDDVDHGVAGNRNGSGTPLSGAMCLGPRCMWWEFARERRGEPQHGYCGATSRPDYQP